MEVISSAFADEIFGKLFAFMGEKDFRERIRINAFANEEAKSLISLIIGKAIKFRKSISAGTL